MPLPYSSTIDSYGGEKEDRAPVANSRTTLAAAEHNAMACDLAMMSRMAPRAYRRFVGGSPPSEPVVGTAHDAVWGNAIAVQPAVEHEGTIGLYIVTWPTAVVDELGNTRAVQLRWAHAWSDVQDMCVISAQVTAPNVVTLRVLLNGASDNLLGETIHVVAY